MAENHMKQGVRGVFAILFLLIAFVLLAAFNWSKPRILVLHSLDEKARSVVKTDEGIRRILAANRQPVLLRWHYLGMNHLTDDAARQREASLAHRSIEQFDPAIIIAVDDEAQQYVARHYVGHERIKLVFTAIDQEPEDYGYIDKENVTGISEILPLEAIRETLIQGREGRPARIAVLTSPMPTGIGKLQQLDSFDWAPHQVVGVHAHGDFESWKTAVDSMAQDVDAILVLSYHGLQASESDATLVPSAVIPRWLNTHAKPLPIGTSSEYVEDGGALSIFPSTLETGELAMQYALGWLRAGNKAELPLIGSAHFRVGTREALLRGWNISLPQIYREAAHIEALYYP
jgi:hypothetical protein